MGIMTSLFSWLRAILLRGNKNYIPVKSARRLQQDEYKNSFHGISWNWDRMRDRWKK